jgi:hypothetical protein
MRDEKNEATIAAQAANGSGKNGGCTSITTTGTGEREEQRLACCTSDAVPGPPGKAITSTEAVIAQLNQEGAQQLVSSGAAAANALGLTSQMPVQQIYLSRSRSQKRYVFGKEQVTIRPAAAWNFLLADRPAGQAIRALDWLGPDQASAALPTLRRVLPPVEWDALLSARAELPLWLAELLSEQALEPPKARG